MDRLLLKTIASESPKVRYQVAKPQLLCQRVEDNSFRLALHKSGSAAQVSQEALGLVKALSPTQDAKRREIKKEIGRLSMDEVSDPSAADA